MNEPEPERETEPFHILFICTGNTCRSPMAEAITRRALAEKGWSHVTVSSAGISAFQGSPASEGSVVTAAARGLDLSEHRSTPLTPAEVERADLILTMSSDHQQVAEEMGGMGKTALLAAFAAGPERERLPGEWTVPDPFGGGEDAYRIALETLERMVARMLDRIDEVVRP